MSAVVGLTDSFDRELCLGGVVGVGDVDIDKSREGKLGGAVSVCLAEIMSETGWFGYRNIHADYVEKGVK